MTARRLFFGWVIGALAIAGCGGGESPSGLCKSGAGGVVTGAADSHCGATVQATDEATCHLAAGPVVDQADGGSLERDGDDGATMFGDEGDDDDCKYHVKWSATPVCEDGGVRFTVTVLRKADGRPATADEPQVEAFLGPTHPAPNSDAEARETSPGVYEVGPIVFDAPGRWTVRFHFYEDCSDTSAESPHGHAAFFVDVP